RDMPAQRRVVLEQALVRTEPQLETFAVIEAVDADNQLPIAQADLEALQLRTIRIRGAQLSALLDVDADRKRRREELAAECADPAIGKHLSADIGLREALAQRIDVRLGLQADDVIR